MKFVGPIKKICVILIYKEEVNYSSQIFFKLSHKYIWADNDDIFY